MSTTGNMAVTSRFKTRFINHFVIIIGSTAGLFALFNFIPSPDTTYLWSMATGYVSVALLTITLLIGPFNIYTKRLNPISSDLRRDFGIWCGVIGLAHVYFGIQVHMGNIWLYFFKSVEGNDAFTLRADVFGAANYVGLLGTILLIVLLLLSNDLSLKMLGTHRWKMIQRWNYFLFATLLVHGILYEVIEKRSITLIVLFGLIMMAALIGQIIGIRARKSVK